MRGLKGRRESNLAESHTADFELLPEDNARLAALCGPLDQNLRLVEQRFGVTVRRRGNQFRVEGERSAGGAQVLRDLFDMTQGGGGVDLTDVHLALREHADTTADTPLRATSVQDPVSDDAARVPRGLIRARGANQKSYLANVHGHDLTFGVGPAGTGKTYLAVACAVEALHSERVRRIVLVRPAVVAGERLGFLPGDLSQKVDPYLRPMYDALYEMMGCERVARFMERNIIEVAPLAFMRGRSLNESFVILDEAQNTTIEQMKMFLTRLGFGSKAVVTGDITQIDLPAGRTSGLVDAIRVVSGIDGIAFVRFDDRDVVRHKLVQAIVKAYEAQGGTSGPTR
jgi:phosphate starvation-inducible PhoH-like protein